MIVCCFILFCTCRAYCIAAGREAAVSSAFSSVFDCSSQVLFDGSSVGYGSLRDSALYASEARFGNMPVRARRSFPHWRGCSHDHDFLFTSSLRLMHSFLCDRYDQVLSCPECYRKWTFSAPRISSLRAALSILTPELLSIPDHTEQTLSRKEQRGNMGHWRLLTHRNAREANRCLM